MNNHPHRPLSTGKPVPHNPKIRDSYSESKKFFKQDEVDPEKSVFFRYEKNVVVIESYGVGVGFQKTNRSDRFKDSRFPNKTFSGDEIFSEIKRMMDDSAEAQRAYDLLRFG